MTLPLNLCATLKRFNAPDFAVADRVELSLVGYADRESRKFDMREWCRENCAADFRQRWSGADTVEFDFEDRTDALLFYTHWMSDQTSLTAYRSRRQ